MIWCLLLYKISVFCEVIELRDDLSNRLEAANVWNVYMIKFSFYVYKFWDMIDVKK